MASAIGIGIQLGMPVGGSGGTSGKSAKLEAINLLAATSTRVGTRTVTAYASDATIADGTSSITVPTLTPAHDGHRLATAVADGAGTGPELSPDPNMLTSGLWTTTGSWAFDTGGGFSCDGVVAGNNDVFLFQAMDEGDRYIVELDITRASGEFVIFNGGSSSTVRFGVGIHTFEIEVSAFGSIGMRAITLGADYTLKGVSSKKVVDRWFDHDINSMLDFNFDIKSPFTKVISTGDSITAGRDYTKYIEKINAYAVNKDVALAGQTLVTIEAAFDADVIASDYDVVTLQGGINDIANAVADISDSMLSDMVSMITKTQASEKELACVLNIGPFGGHTTWNSSRQTWLESYNDKLSSYLTTNGIVLVDMYTLLAVGIDINPLYDSGDGLHPNEVGDEILAQDIDSKISAIIRNSINIPTELPDPKGMSNTISGLNGATDDDKSFITIPATVKAKQFNGSFVFTPIDTAAVGAVVSSFVDANNLLKCHLNGTQAVFEGVLASVPFGPAAFAYATTALTPCEFIVGYEGTTLSVGARDVGGGAPTLATAVFSGDLPLASLLGLGTDSNGGSTLKFESMQRPIFAASLALLPT